MYPRAYARPCICTHTHTCIYACTHAHSDTHGCIRAHACMHKHAHTDAHAHTHTWLHKCISHMHTWARTCTTTRTHTCTPTHAYVHTRALVPMQTVIDLYYHYKFFYILVLHKYFKHFCTSSYPWASYLHMTNRPGGNYPWVQTINPFWAEGHTSEW